MSSARLNNESLELIYTDAKAALDELLLDRHNLKQGSQLTITTSAILLGLILNLARVPATTIYGTPEKFALGIATTLLIGSTVLSLILQFSVRFTSGHISPQSLYERYAYSPPLEVRKEQLGHIIDVIDDTRASLPKLGRWTNIARLLIVLAVVLSGFVLIYGLVTN